jgi:hypothetical protein
LPGALVSLLRGCAHVSPGLFIGLREEMQSVGVLLGGFDDCCEPDRSGCVAHELSGELGVDVSGSQVVAAGVKRFGCSPAVESFRHPMPSILLPVSASLAMTVKAGMARR